MRVHQPGVTGSLNVTGSLYVCGYSNLYEGDTPYAPYALQTSGSVELSYYGVGPNPVAWAVSTASPVGTQQAGSAGNSAGAGILGGTYPSVVSPTSPIQPQQKSFQVWDGSSWSTSNTMCRGGFKCASGGTANSILAMGALGYIGETPPYSSWKEAEVYNGSSWSTISDIPNSTAPAYSGMCVGAYLMGDATSENSGFLVGGYDLPNLSSPSMACGHLNYNGSAWSTETDMPSVRAGGNASGAVNDGIVIGGWINPSFTDTPTTVEYNGSAWSSGGNTSVINRNFASSGVDTSCVLIFGGPAPASPWNTTATEEYNGNSWSTGPNLNVERRDLTGTGTGISTMAHGGYAPPNYSRQTSTEVYENSSAWRSGFHFCRSTGDVVQKSAVILTKVSSSYDYADDTAAASGGIELGGLYRSGSFVKIRLE
jgi:hypothetical protein